MPEKRGMGFFLLAVLGSLFAGIVNGVLGTGAGTVFFLVMRRIFRDSDDVSPKDCFAASMTAVLPVSLMSLFTYAGEATESGDLLLTLVLPGAAGGLLGAFLSDRLAQKTLKKIFAAVVIFGGAYMVFG